MILAKVLARRHLTIPREIRERVHLSPGDTVQVDVDEAGVTHLRRLRTLTFQEMFERNLVDVPVHWPSLVKEAEQKEADEILRAMKLEPPGE